MLKNKVIVITGATGLIGEEFVKTVIENSGTAIVADINLERKKILEDKFNENIDFLKLDITNKENISNAIRFLNEKYGRIDAVINNAYPRNMDYGKHFYDVSYDSFIDNIGMHIGGYFLVSQQFAKYFEQQGYGNIINMASIYGVIAPKFNIYQDLDMTTPVEYAAIKSSIIHLTKYMANYLKGKNIRVNAISPGGIYNNQDNEFIRGYSENCLSKGMLDKSDINGTLIYLLSDLSRYVNGQNIIVDDGFTL